MWFNCTGDHSPLKVCFDFDNISNKEASKGLIPLLLDLSRCWVHLSLAAEAPVLYRLTADLRDSPQSWNRLQYLSLLSSPDEISGSDILLQLLQKDEQQLPVLQTLDLSNMCLPALSRFPSHPTLMTLRFHFCHISAETMKPFFSPCNFPCFRNVELDCLSLSSLSGDRWIPRRIPNSSPWYTEDFCTCRRPL